MYEIGSDFNLNLSALTLSDCNIFDYLKSFNTIYLNSGRSAIKLLEMNIEYENVLLPEYICDSVIDCFNKNYIDYYQLNKNFEINIDDLVKKLKGGVTIVYVSHYFGSLQPKNVLERLKNLKSNSLIIIEDTTQCFLSELNSIGDYCICSLRKWFNSPAGGVLYSNKDIGQFKCSNGMKNDRNINFDKTLGMIQKDIFLNVNDDFKEKTYLSKLKAGEELFEKTPIIKMSTLDEYILKTNNIKKVVSKRRTNFNYLSRKLVKFKSLDVFSVNQDFVPFNLVIFLKKRDELRKFLIDNNIYVSIHWPLSKRCLINNRRNKFINTRILSIPIDQRYNINDMEYIYYKISQFFS